MERLHLILAVLYFRYVNLKGRSCTISGSFTRQVERCSCFIRKVVLKAFKSSKEMSWLPTIDDTEKMSTEKPCFQWK